MDHHDIDGSGCVCCGVPCDAGTCDSCHEAHLRAVLRDRATPARLRRLATQALLDMGLNPDPPRIEIL